MAFYLRHRPPWELRSCRTFAQSVPPAVLYDHGSAAVRSHISGSQRSRPGFNRRHANPATLKPTAPTWSHETRAPHWLQLPADQQAPGFGRRVSALSINQVSLADGLLQEHRDDAIKIVWLPLPSTTSDTLCQRSIRGGALVERGHRSVRFALSYPPFALSYLCSLSALELLVKAAGNNCGHKKLGEECNTRDRDT